MTRQTGKWRTVCTTVAIRLGDDRARYGRNVGEDLHEINVVAPAGTSLLLVTSRGEWRQFMVHDDDTIIVPARYDEAKPWTVRIPGHRRLADALAEYFEDGEAHGLSDLAGAP